MAEQTQEQTQEYLHTDPVRWLEPITEDDMSSTHKLYEKLVPYKGSEVLAVQRERRDRHHHTHPYTVVPGTIVEHRTGKTEFGVPVSLVRPVDKRYQPDLEKVIANSGFKGKITFWEKPSKEYKQYLNSIKVS